MSIMRSDQSMKQQSQRNQQQIDTQQSNHAEHRTDQSRTVDQLLQLDNLRAEIIDRQEQLAPWHAVEREQLAEQQSMMRKQLGADTGMERAMSTATQRANLEINLEIVNQFQQSEREEMQQRQYLEQEVLSVQAEVTAKLYHFLNRNGNVEGLTQDARQNRQATLDLTQERSSNLEERFNQQIEKLTEFQELVATQQAQERRALEQAFQMRPGPVRWEAMQAALLQQENGRQQRETQADQIFSYLRGRHEAEQEAVAAQVRQAANNSILEQKFSQNKAVSDLWEDAVKAARQEPDLTTSELARKEYERTMARFITRLTRENDNQAAQARKAFEDDGFRFLRKEDGHLKRALPILNLPDIEKQIDMRRHADLLRISGQHLIMVSDKLRDGPSKALDSNNLVWMIARDNMHMDIDRIVQEKEAQRRIDREIREQVIKEILERDKNA